MKVTKAQAQANREHIVQTASVLFREHGYDGVGVADLMAAAGFTHGGFYKHFGSKADLMAEAAACGFATSSAATAGATPASFVEHYLSRQHRDKRDTGCTVAALGGDAARHSNAIKAHFAAGIEQMVADLISDGSAPSPEDRAERLAMIAQIAGALMLSRACPDDAPLAGEILDVCRTKILAGLTRHQE